MEELPTSSALRRSCSHIESPQVLRSANYLDRQGKMPVRWAWVHRIGYSPWRRIRQNTIRFLVTLWGKEASTSGILGSVMRVGITFPAPRPFPEPRRLRDAQRRASAQSCEITPGTRGYDGHLAAAALQGLTAGQFACVATDRGLDAADSDCRSANPANRHHDSWRRSSNKGGDSTTEPLVRPEQAGFGICQVRFLDELSRQDLSRTRGDSTPKLRAGLSCPG